MTDSQLNTLKVLGIGAVVVAGVVVLYPLFSSLSKTAGNVGKVVTDITGTVADLTGDVKKSVENVDQYVFGNSANQLAGYKQGAWAQMISDPTKNPFSSAYVYQATGYNGMAQLPANEISADAITGELQSNFWVSPDNLSSFFAAIPTIDDVFSVIQLVQSDSRLGVGFSVLAYLTNAMSSDWQDAIAGNILSKPA